jgi:hypothetical protein
MKSFKQFLEENNLNEEPAGRPAGRRTGGPSYDEVKAGIDAKEAEKAAKRAQRGPTGAAARSDLQFRPQGTTTTVPGSDVRGPQGPTSPTSSPSPSSPITGRRSRVNGRVVPGVDTRQLPKPATPTASTPVKPTGTPVRPSIGNVSGPATSPKTPKQPVRPSIGNVSGPATSPKKPQAFKPATIDAASSTSPSVSGAPKPSPAPSSGPGPGGGPKPPSGPGPGGGPKPPSGPKPPVGKPPMVKGLKASGVRGGGVLAGVIDTAVEKSSGSGWARSLAKGATTALGTVAGGALGSAAGPVGTFAGGTAGGMAASKAFDTAAGANAVQRKAIATANRQSQSGGAIKGIGGKTTFDTKKNTITSGGKTAQLGKTSVVTDPKTGKQDTGYLAYKGGKAVYKRADTKSLAQTSSNPLERIGRSLFAGAYKQSDAANAAKKLATARQSDTARNKALGVKFGPGK